MTELTKSQAFVIRAVAIALAGMVFGLIGVFAFDDGILYTISRWLVGISIVVGVIFGFGSFFTYLENDKDK